MQTLAQCSPCRTAAARPLSSSGACTRRPQRAVRAAAKQQAKEQQQEQLPADLPLVSTPAAVPESDPWEGENLEIIGQIGQLMIPIIAAAGVGIGLFATSTYNEGATVFLDVPKSTVDTARLVPAEDLMR